MTIQALVIGIGVIRAIGIVIRRSFAGITQWRIAGTLSRQVVGRLVTQPIGWHQRRPDGDLVARAGVDAFWASPAGDAPRVRVVEIAPVALLLGLCVGLTILAGPVMGYMEATARSLHAPQGYVAGVLPAPDAAGAGR